MHGVVGWLQRRWARRVEPVPAYSHLQRAGETREAAPGGAPPSGGRPSGAISGVAPRNGATGAGQTGQTDVLIALVDGCTIDMTVASILSQAGYGVRVARGLPGALQSLRDAAPAMVIVCGFAAVETFMALRGATRVPVLALLLDATEAETLDVLAAGADDCQPVSIGNAEVLSRVRALLRRSYR